MRVRLLVFAVGMAACTGHGQGQGAGKDDSVCAQGSAAAQAACRYLVTFYPRWFSYRQLKLLPANLFFGPETVDPQFEKIVAVNVDTLYASAQIDVTSEPVIVTVPPTTDVYSVLHLDQYGKAFAGIPSGMPGVYGLTSPGWQGSLPAGAKAVPMPYALSILILRADRYSVTGEDTQQAAAQFRRDLHIAPLSRYASDPTTGSTAILPVGLFSTSFKVMADNAVTSDPMQFLTDMQTAVQASTTQPLTMDEQSLANAFDAALVNSANAADVAAGARAGYQAILDNYEAHTIGGSRWINFNDIAAWDGSFQGLLNRATIAEYLQYGNARQAAVYYHTFLDANGGRLDGSAGTYSLRFAAGQLPDVGRFWSLTAYTPDTVELVSNSASKYAVASYTPGLVRGADGSVTITMAVTQPADVPAANWLPVPSGPFNVVLRAYAPRGSVLDGSYVPPAVVGAPR